MAMVMVVIVQLHYVMQLFLNSTWGSDEERKDKLLLIMFMDDNDDTDEDIKLVCVKFGEKSTGMDRISESIFLFFP